MTNHNVPARFLPKRPASSGPPLEHSPEDFAATFATYAAVGELLPQPESLPLLEFVSGDLALYLVDRCGPYLPAGPCRMVLHALIDPHHTGPAPAPPENPLATHLEATGRSQVRGLGQVLERRRQGVVVNAGLPLVLSCPSLPPYPAGGWSLPLAVGDWLNFATLPPIHGFWLPPAGEEQPPGSSQT